MDASLWGPPLPPDGGEGGEEEDGGMFRDAVRFLQTLLFGQLWGQDKGEDELNDNAKNRENVTNKANVRNARVNKIYVRNELKP